MSRLGTNTLGRLAKAASRLARAARAATGVSVSPKAEIEEIGRNIFSPSENPYDDPRNPHLTLSLSFVNDSLPHSIVEERILQKKNGIRRVSNTHHHYSEEHGGHSVHYYSKYGSNYHIVCKEENPTHAPVTSEPTEAPAPKPIPVSVSLCIHFSYIAKLFSLCILSLARTHHRYGGANREPYT